MSIRIDDLTVTFKNGVTAVDHVDLEIPHGIFGLLGENGAGKTTLMRVLTTVLAPTIGKVLLDGTLYCEANYEKIQKKILMCISLCVFENVWSIWEIWLELRKEKARKGLITIWRRPVLQTIRKRKCGSFQVE